MNVQTATEWADRVGRPPRDEVFFRLHVQVSELWERMGGLPSPVEAADIWTDIWHQETHHSTAIEGNTLVQNQVDELLAQGRAIGAKQLSEYMEVRGYADAANWVYRQGIQPGAWANDQIITLTEVRQVHTAAMAAVWEVAPHPDASDREGPGSFREQEIQEFDGGMQPVTWPLIESELGAWITMVNEAPASGPTFAEAMAQLHCRFEQIHPFLDGNGRVGRLVLNLILVRLGYPPAIIYKRQRQDYLRALRRADAGDPGQLGELLARAILDNLYRFVVPAVAGPVRLVPLAALATDEITAGALRVAATRGRLQATRGPDGQWRSCRNWVNDYLISRYRQGGR